MVSAQPPLASDPAWPRFSGHPLPAYRYVPGIAPHPRRDPRGHSFGRGEPRCAAWAPEQWHELPAWLYAVDLYNFAYWWESHEQLEALWIAGDRTTRHADFVRGLLQVAAALLNRHVGRAGAPRLAQRGTARMRAVLAVGADRCSGADMRRDLRTDLGTYMGMDVGSFATAVDELFAARRGEPPLIRLAL